MTKRIAALALAALIVCGILSFAAAAYRSYDETATDYPALSETVHQADGDYAVIVKTDGVRPDFRQLHPTCAVEGPDNTYVICFDNAKQADKAVQQTQEMRGVAYAEPNGVVTAQGEAITYTTYGAQMMGLDVFAQSLLRRESLTPAVVAVLDSGIVPELTVFEGRLLPGRSFVQVRTDSEDPESTVYLPYDEDAYGHGTSVASIVADCTQGLPVQILPVRVLDDVGNGTYLDTANGIRYAADQGVDVINLSFVSKTCSQYLHDAIRYALTDDSLTVTSSGNYTINMDKKDCCPAHLQDGIVVSGCAQDDSLYKKSCYGTSVDVCAPAIDVPCTKASGATGYADGTSFAAPHVSAAAAMLRIYMPGADCDMLISLLTENARDIGETGFDTRTGWGVPDLRALDGSQIPDKEHVATGMTIVTLPDKMQYYYKEAFVSDGFSARMWYSDGTSEICTTGFVFVGTENMHRGTNTVSAQKEGQHAEFAVDVRLHWWQWLIWVPLFGFLWY